MIPARGYSAGRAGVYSGPARGPWAQSRGPARGPWAESGPIHCEGSARNAATWAGQPGCSMRPGPWSLGSPQIRADRTGRVKSGPETHPVCGTTLAALSALCAPVRVGLTRQDLRVIVSPGTATGQDEQREDRPDVGADPRRWTTRCRSRSEPTGASTAVGFTPPRSAAMPTGTPPTSCADVFKASFRITPVLYVCVLLLFSHAERCGTTL